MALAVGGYGFLLDVHRPAPTYGDPSTLPGPRFQIEPPTRLERLREAMPAAAQLGFAARADARLRIELDGVDRAGLPDTAGVAVIAADTEAQLQWLPLAAFAAEGAVLVAESTVPTQPLAVTFAACPTASLRSWWARMEITPNGAGATRVALVAGVHTVRVETALPAGQSLHGRQPFALRRADAPDWHFSGVDGAIAVVASDDGVLQLLLGDGDYTLTMLSAPDLQPCSFRVPTNGVVRAEFGK